MKLYVVGEDTPDPKQWSAWSEWSLVIAPDEATARALAEHGAHVPVCEVPLTEAMHLVTMSEPAHGDDL